MVGEPNRSAPSIERTLTEALTRPGGSKPRVPAALRTRSVICAIGTQGVAGGIETEMSGRPMKLNSHGTRTLPSCRPDASCAAVSDSRGSSYLATTAAKNETGRSGVGDGVGGREAGGVAAVAAVAAVDQGVGVIRIEGGGVAPVTLVADGAALPQPAAANARTVVSRSPQAGPRAGPIPRQFHRAQQPPRSVVFACPAKPRLSARRGGRMASAPGNRSTPRIARGRCVLSSGAPGGTRTHDLQVRNLALYPLSYGRIVRCPSPDESAGDGKAGGEGGI